MTVTSVEIRFPQPVAMTDADMSALRDIAARMGADTRPAIFLAESNPPPEVPGPATAGGEG